MPSDPLYGERAETHLRLLVEAALRPGPEVDAQQVHRAADLLVEADVLTGERVAWILLDLAVALRARGLLEPGLIRQRRIRTFTAASSSRRDILPGEWRVIPGPDPAPGTHVMALILTPDRVLAPAALGFPPSVGDTDPQEVPWAGLSAADDAGTDYLTTVAQGAWAGSSWTGTLLIRPAPPPDATWIKIFVPNGFSLTVPLHPPPPSGSTTHSMSSRSAPEPAPRSTPGPAPRSTPGSAPGSAPPSSTPNAVPASTPPSAPASAQPEATAGAPGERLLTRYAESLLAASARGFFTANPRGFASVEPGFDELTGTLEAAGALPPLSPLPRQVAELRALLGLPEPEPPTATAAAPAAAPSAAGPLGTGSSGAGPSGAGPSAAAPASKPGPASDLPRRWLDLAAHYGRRKHVRPVSGTAGIGVRLPDIDGARFVVAGLHSGPEGTHLLVVSRGLRALPRQVPPGLEGHTEFSWWLRDETGLPGNPGLSGTTGLRGNTGLWGNTGRRGNTGGGWHLGSIDEAIPAAEETLLRMALLPPLTHKPATLTAEVTAPTTRLTTALPLRWQ